MHNVKNYFGYFLGVIYVLAGVNHFWHPTFYTNMLEGFLPYPAALVIISGIAEILCGLGLLIPATRKAAAWGPIALLIAVFPANINMAMHPDQFHLPAAGLYARLPIQLLLFWISYLYTKD